MFLLIKFNLCHKPDVVDDFFFQMDFYPEKIIIENRNSKEKKGEKRPPSWRFVNSVCSAAGLTCCNFVHRGQLFHVSAWSAVKIKDNTMNNIGFGFISPRWIQLLEVIYSPPIIWRALIFLIDICFVSVQQCQLVCEWLHGWGPGMLCLSYSPQFAFSKHWQIAFRLVIHGVQTYQVFVLQRDMCRCVRETERIMRIRIIFFFIFL